MSWFGSSPDDKRASDVRSGAVAPRRSERQRCYVARDAYFGCLDAHDIVDALQDHKKAARACKAETADFERDCATQWVSFIFPLFSSSLGWGFRGLGMCWLTVWGQVKYFKEWRVQTMKKQATLRELEAQGAQKMELQPQFEQK